ncbi:MAG TPA: alanine racemase [Acidiferrobacteraceae bacterium]|nr:alanine racemase [Acidiferrobacteraceae bacterium]
MSRPVQAMLDADALTANLARVRECAPGARVMAVVKANGYGHGLSWVAQHLQRAHVDALAVASIEEALELRAGGIVEPPICLLEGFFQAEEIAVAAQHRLEVVVHNYEQLTALEAAPPLPRGLDVWLKLDTGMHRLGFPVADAHQVYTRLRACAAVQTLRMLSHFARADEPAESATDIQLNAFLQAAPPGVERSIANSAAVLEWPRSRLEWVRPGLMLYGLSPLPERSASALGLTPVMTLTSAVIAVHRLPQGAAVGYGGSFVCPEAMPVGVVAGGYGDGYPRHARAGTPVRIGSCCVPLIGRVSMDMITVDLRRRPETRVGDPVVLWGRDLPAEEIAVAAGTIPYTLVCGVTPRVPRRS